MDRPRVDPASPSIAILGAGCAGICMAISLLEKGNHDFVIFEKAQSLGGTWRDNTYPGCACDVPSHLYSFSFAQRSGWRRRFAPQSEILAYLRQVANEHGVDRHIRFGTRITALQWSDVDSAWTLVADDGRRFVARVVISAVGGLHLPAMPGIEGLDSFAGPCFHSARWDHTVDLTGKRVAVIGTGASAVQIVPAIAPRVSKLLVFQRSAAWILNRHDRPYTWLERFAYRRVPGLLRLSRWLHFWRAEVTAIGFTLLRKKVARGQKKSRRFLSATIADRDVCDRLSPNYALGCKRVLLSDDFYPSLTLPQVELVTDSITRITPRTIVTGDGREHEADVIVCATGFLPFNPSAEIEIYGRGGRTLSEEWKSGPQAFRGVAVAGYPNYFMLMGPNSGLGHNSVLFMIESQVRYIGQCLTWLERGQLTAVEVTAEAQRACVDAIERRFLRTVWETPPEQKWPLPCTSWYRHASGRITALWPGFAVEYWRIMRRADLRHFRPTAG
jgi:cation diffusion facilitator CzcD-associated flavoprotein CzcO